MSYYKVTITLYVQADSVVDADNIARDELSTRDMVKAVVEKSTKKEAESFSPWLKEVKHQWVKS